MKTKKLIGPFRQLLTMSGLSTKGAASDERLQVIENAGIGIENGYITEVGSFNKMTTSYTEIDEITEEVVGLGNHLLEASGDF